MISDTKNSPEWKAFEEFTKTKEFTDLTRGENAKIKDFDINSAEKLQELRDVIYQDAPAVYHDDESQSNLESVLLTKWQVGHVLIERKKYRQYDEEHPIQVEKDNPTATTKRPGYVGRVLGRIGPIRC